MDTALAKFVLAHDTTPASVPLMNEEAFASFHQITIRPLRAYISRVLNNSTEADDIAQEAYLRLLRHCPTTDQLSELRPLLFRIASNLIVDHWRRRRREVPQTDRRPEPESADPDPSVRLDMLGVFDQLRPQERAMMWLAYVEGADHREIAAALGLRSGSVRVLLYRTRHKLANLLKDK